MDNNTKKNSNNNNNNNSNNNSIKNKNKKLKLTLPIFLGILVLSSFIIIVLSGNFEKSDSLQPYGSRFTKILILLLFIYFIISTILKKKINTKKTNFLGLFKVEKSLIIYLFVILIVAIIL